jgi:hypothetical protein
MLASHVPMAAERLGSRLVTATYLIRLPFVVEMCPCHSLRSHQRLELASPCVR